MESLYVCHFSNGAIKVGVSRQPSFRINQHADRVACMGVKLLRSHVVPCVTDDDQREQGLITRCVEACSARHRLEWFEGLVYDQVCQWADECAKAPEEEALVESMWPGVIRDIRASGLTQMDIAGLCGCNQTSISKLLTGYATEPLYGLGTKLIALRRERAALSQSDERGIEGADERGDSLLSHGKKFTAQPTFNHRQVA